MIPSQVIFENGRVNLYIDEKRQPACAYITYFDERSCCQDFADAGYEIFSLCAYFSGLPLNSIAVGFSPHPGIFDVKGQADYSGFDTYVRQIVNACPTARIFPRVRVAMPQWWIDENPSEVCLCNGGFYRESLYSDRFRETGAEMLRDFIAHVHASDYAEHIIGYQIASGCTEEWFHYDKNGSFCPSSENAFREYMKKPVSVPSSECFHVEGCIEDPTARQYLEFINASTADTLAYFAHVTKEAVGYQQIVGAFYGYTPSISSALRGSLGLHKLLHCPDIDFFCTPASYIQSRALGIDWAEQAPGESIKQHGKLYFMENDVRTCLSKLPGESRPGIDPLWKYTAPVWLGPPTEEESVWAMRKAYARQLTHGNALWWFDMWGSWYASEKLMEEARLCLSLMQQEPSCTTRSQIAVLCDEKYPYRIGSKNPCFEIQNTVHDRLGNTGFTHDLLLTEDYEQCIHYESVLIPVPAEYDTEETVTIKEFLNANQIPYVQLTTHDFDITADELRHRLQSTGVHCYCDSGDVIYCGNGYLAIHAASAGGKCISLPQMTAITPIAPCGSMITADTLYIEMKKFETRLYTIKYEL